MANLRHDRFNAQHMNPYYMQLLEGRTIQVMGGINDQLASRVIMELHYLDNDNPSLPITLEIMSGGGDVYAGLAIIDAAKLATAPIRTVGLGLVASMAAMILSCAGDMGERYVTPNCEVMIHQVLTGMSGSQSDIAIAAQHILSIRDRLDSLLAGATGKEIDEIHCATDRDNWFNAYEAISFGLADKIAGE